MIDEAFGRGSEESTKFGLELFSRLGLQLLTVTPLQKIQVIENYVDALAYVRPIDPRSQLISMPIEEYRAKRRRHGARASGNDPYLPAENDSSHDEPTEVVMTSTRLDRSDSPAGPRGWSTLTTVKSAARKLWDRGAILRELNLPPEEWVSFPHRVRLSGPSAADLVEHRADAQAWSRTFNDSAANAEWDLLTKRIRARRSRHANNSHGCDHLLADGRSQPTRTHTNRRGHQVPRATRCHRSARPPRARNRTSTPVRRPRGW